jgi:putative PIN family toxin of toxin-antitoxin system
VVKRPIVVIDTQIILRAAIKVNSLSNRILVDLRDRYELIFSAEIRAELADVLSRPKLRAKYKTITDERAAELLALFDAGTLVEPPDIPPTSRDPKDDKFLAAAAESKADYLVSEDNDLLTLKTHGTTRIVNALDFLQILLDLPQDES